MVVKVLSRIVRKCFVVMVLFDRFLRVKVLFIGCFELIRRVVLCMVVVVWFVEVECVIVVIVL